MDAPRATIARARRLRRALTPPEARLWVALRRRPDGLKFRRQHPYGPFVLDFYCDEAKLAIEVDGLAHDMGGNPARDVRRDAYLAARGLAVLRVSAEDVRVNLPGVVNTIVAGAAERDRRGEGPPPPCSRLRRTAWSPSPCGGGDEAPPRREK